MSTQLQDEVALLLQRERFDPRCHAFVEALVAFACGLTSKDFEHLHGLIEASTNLSEADKRKVHREVESARQLLKR
jgi:hypothetical protein